jgi:predicted RNase H-like HicB family nuclease
MNKAAIFKTVICREEEGHFVVFSPLCDGAIGTGATLNDAVLSFKSVIQDRYVAHLEGRLAPSDRKVGRPRKQLSADFHTQIKEDVKQSIVELAKELDLSQGDIIEFLYRCYIQTKDKLHLPEEANVCLR